MHSEVCWFSCSANAIVWTQEVHFSADVDIARVSEYLNPDLFAQVTAHLLLLFSNTFLYI